MDKRIKVAIVSSLFGAFTMIFGVCSIIVGVSSLDGSGDIKKLLIISAVNWVMTAVCIGFSIYNFRTVKENLRKNKTE